MSIFLGQLKQLFKHHFPQKDVIFKLVNKFFSNAGFSRRVDHVIYPYLPLGLIR